MSDTDRGEKVVRVSRPGLNQALFRDGPARRVDLPDDVEVEELWHERTGEAYRVRLSSTAWDATDEGEPLEVINPTIRDAEPDGGDT